MTDLANNPDALLADFTDWLSGDPQIEGVRSFIEAYHNHLAMDIGEDRADETVKALFKLMSERPDAWGPLFDRIYSTPGSGFNLEPNRLVVETTAGLQPGNAIDVAMGQGRNAVYLASQGWAVTGIDLSAVGVETARAAAAHRGLEIDARIVGHHDFDFGEDRWDLMVFTYAPVRLTDPAMVGRVRKALRPEGRIVAESFRRPDEGPPRPVDLLGEDLAKAYESFRIDRLDTVEELPDWDSQPQQLVRFVAAKTS